MFLIMPDYLISSHNLMFYEIQISRSKEIKEN